MKRTHKLALAMLAGVSIGTAAALVIHAQQIRTPPAYVVAELNVTDPTPHRGYSAKIPETLASFHGHFIARGGKTQAIEGTPPKLFSLISISPSDDDVGRKNVWHNMKVVHVAGTFSCQESRKGAASGAKDRIPFPVFPVVVDCDQTMEQMVKAGRYDWVELDINSGNFPVNCHGVSKVEIVLVPFQSRSMGSEDILRELDKHGLRAAELPELLAFGATYPEKQREDPPIVALGSARQNWESRRGAAYLGGGSGGRSLGGPGCWGPGCHTYYQLAAVIRK